VSGSLASLLVSFLVLVLVAQINPARLVVLRPLQGTAVVFVAAVSTPFVLGLVAILFAHRRAETAVAWTAIAGCALLVMACATPLLDITIEKER
jgi:hypothetical protein